jgi:hypothetical protein
MRVLTTPASAFDHVPDFDFEPRYADVGGLRMAYVQAGPDDGEPVLLAAPGGLGEAVPRGVQRLIEHPVLTGAGHFLQEDAGDRLAAEIVKFVPRH